MNVTAGHIKTPDPKLLLPPNDVSKEKLTIPVTPVQDTKT